MEETSNRIRKLVCPKCGCDNLQITTETQAHTSGKNYSSGKGCLGYLMFGPLGLLCGSCGQKQKTTVTNTNYWVCPNCGNKFRNPDDIKDEISRYKRIASLPMLLVMLGLVSFLAVLGASIDLTAFVWFGIICGAIFLLSWILIKLYAIPKVEKELAEIEEGMARFK